MGLFNKLKNVLFEEEEVEIPIITKKTEEEPKEMREQIRSSNSRSSNYSFEDTEEIEIDDTKDNINRFRNVKRDIDVDIDDNLDEKTEEIPISETKKETSSPFLSFDEDEFERLNSKIKDNEEKQEKVVKEKEKSKKKEEPVRRVEAPKRFRPSPVISPVYGILDKNYKKEDIVEKGNESQVVLEEVSIEAVRKKAYGTLVDDIESSLGEEKALPKEEKVDERSIDEILTESIDETINLDEELDIPKSIDNNDVEDLLDEEVETPITEELENDEPILQDEEIELPSFESLNNEKEEDSLDEELLEKTNTIKILDDIDENIDDVKVNKDLLEDTTETDLFNLIDSMYENREDDK